jgi:hypothetical protein
MHGRRRNQEAMQRTADRRRREDDAPRLSEEIPRLATLVMRVTDGDAGGMNRTEHIKRVVVANAPALFEIVCLNHDCKEGGHDITDSVMRALRTGATKFDGRDTCHGSVANNNCGHVLEYVAEATYTSLRPEPEPEQAKRPAHCPSPVACRRSPVSPEHRKGNRRRATGFGSVLRHKHTPP